MIKIWRGRIRPLEQGAVSAPGPTVPRLFISDGSAFENISKKKIKIISFPPSSLQGSQAEPTTRMQGIVVCAVSVDQQS